MVEQVLPALVDALDLVIDLALLGLVGGRDELLSQLLQVSFVLTEQVDLLHTVLHRQEGREKTQTQHHLTFLVVHIRAFIKKKKSFKKKKETGP